MDDYKRALYMAVRTELVERKKRGLSGFVCNLLVCTVRDEDSKFFISKTALEVTEGLFQEFKALFDGTAWFGHEKRDAEEYYAWWAHKDLDARIRALDCILRD